MTQLKIAWKAWVVVCDGSKALLLKNEGDPDLVNLKVEEHFEDDAPPSRDLGTDRPGRVQESATTGRSAVEETDWHQKEEAEFLDRLAARLDDLVQKQGVKHLVLVAPPKALGHLRGTLSDHVKAAIQAEIDKDLTKLPVYEIEKHLAG